MTFYLKRTVCLALVVILAAATAAFAENGANDIPVPVAPNAANGVVADPDDSLIQTDPVDNTYTGRANVNALIHQLQFTDLPEEGRDAIIRSNTLGIFRPSGGVFRPNAPITNEEAIAFAVRVMGHSFTANERAVSIAADLPQGTPLSATWSLGYMDVASAAGIIPAEWATQAIEATQALFDPETNGINGGIFEETLEPEEEPPFDRTAVAARQDIAAWIFGALQYISPEIAAAPGVGSPLNTFTDGAAVAASAVAGANFLLRNNIMRGQTATAFGPTSPVNRAEMAQIIRNLDNFHYAALGLVRRSGVVADITHEQYAETGTWTIWRHIHVRRADGGVDMLQFSQTGSPSPQDGPLEAVVLRGGNVMGLTGLEEGDSIEYLVHPATGTVWYVYVTSRAATRTERLRLELIDMERGTMTFRNDDYVVFTFPMSSGLYGTGPDGVPFIRMRVNQLVPAASLPLGSFYDVELVGSVVVAVEFVGDPVLIPEHRGIVVINNPEFGYLTILDAGSNERDFTYNPGQLVVQRRQFYDARDTIGGMHEMFPSVHPDPRTADISAVTVGDIAVFRVAEDDPFRIIELFAVENTTTRYGRIMQIVDHGGYFDILMEFENGRTAWYRFVQGIRVMQNGVPSNPNVIAPGDWARIIVNQHIIAPGIMEESVREIALDGGGHHITNVISGQLSGFNAAQNAMQVQHAQELTPAGWSNHSPLASIDIGGPNVRYFHNGAPVTLAHINRYLQRDPNATVYMALENHFAGERAVHVNILGGNRLTRYGTVISAANNQFSLLEIPAPIQANAATIVVRNGRLVGPENIQPGAWARVSLVGATAAVVDIGPAPATDGVQIVRGRVSRVMPFESFRVETSSIFDGFRWNFTPVEREFTIDNNTLFINAGGVTTIDEFIGYTDASVIGDVFNVVVEGGRALRVIDAPFTEPNPPTATASGHLTMRGIIYANDGATVSLRDVTVYNPVTGAWAPYSTTNATGSVTLAANSVIIDRNQVIPAANLRIGHQILAFSNANLDAVELEPGLSAPAYIVLVEN